MSVYVWDGFFSSSFFLVYFVPQICRFYRVVNVCGTNKSVLLRFIFYTSKQIYGFNVNETTDMTHAHRLIHIFMRVTVFDYYSNTCDYARLVTCICVNMWIGTKRREEKMF